MWETAFIAICVNIVLWILTMILMLQYVRLGKISRQQSMVNNNTSDLPCVAIVIVAQEEAEELRRHLPVFLTQKYPADYQVIVVDIHSTDDTLKMLEELEEHYPQLTHSSIPPSARDISKQRLAMMLGMKTACTEWVIFTKADCCPANDEWLASFMRNNTQGKNAIIGMTKYASCNNLLMQKRQFLRLWKQMIWIPFAENHYPYRADDELLAYRKEFFFEQNGFESDSRLLVGAASLLVNKNISAERCAISVRPDAILIQDNPPAHTWLQERVFCVDTFKHAANKYLYCSWYVIRLLLPLIYTITTIGTCFLWMDNYYVIGLMVFLWLSVKVIRDIAFNRTAKQFNIKAYHLLLPYLCAVIPLWELQAWTKWRLTSKKAFRKKFV